MKHHTKDERPAQGQRDESPAPVEVDTYFKALRSEDALELLKASVNAFALLYIVALRAQRTNSFNRHGLKPGEALVGDFYNYGMSKKAYRLAKQLLQKWHFAAFRGTHRGTIATLLNTRVFDVNLETEGTQKVTLGAHSGHTQGTLRAPTKNVKNAKNGKNAKNLLRRSAKQKRFSLEAVLSEAAKLGMPKEGAQHCFDHHTARGWRGIVDLPAALRCWMASPYYRNGAAKSANDGNQMPEKLELRRLPI